MAHDKPLQGSSLGPSLGPEAVDTAILQWYKCHRARPPSCYRLPIILFCWQDCNVTCFLGFLGEKRLSQDWHLMVLLRRFVLQQTELGGRGSVFSHGHGAFVLCHLATLLSKIQGEVTPYRAWRPCSSSPSQVPDIVQTPKCNFLTFADPQKQSWASKKVSRAFKSKGMRNQLLASHLLKEFTGSAKFSLFFVISSGFCACWPETEAEKRWRGALCQNREIYRKKPRNNHFQGHLEVFRGQKSPQVCFRSAS